MKLIHCADIHLDGSMMPSLSRDQMNIRKMEMLRTFTRMVDYAASNGVKIVMISGNLFDTRNIPVNIRNQVMDSIVSNPDIDFIYLQGQGKNDNFLSRVEEIPSNLLLFDREWKTYHYGRIAISGKEPEMGITEEVMQNLADGQLFLDSSDFNIVMLQEKEDPSQSQKMRNQNVDYLAMGGCDTYSFSQLDARGYFCYPGSLEGRSFEECEDHGFILMDINEETLRPSFGFVPISARCHYIVPVDISRVLTSQEAIEIIEHKLAEDKYPSTSLIRIVLRGKLEVNAAINKKRMNEHFKSNYFYTEIVDETELEIDSEEFAKDASLRGEFIRMVLASDFDDQKKMNIIRCGVELLSGEEM